MKKIKFKLKYGKGFSSEDILAKISIPLDDNVTVIVYSSFSEGLGNRYSDIDVYVFYDSTKTIIKNSTQFYGDCDLVDRFSIDDTELDIEYRSIAGITKNIDKIIKSNGRSGSYDDLKVLLRVYYGDVIHNSELANDLFNRALNSGLLNLISNKFHLETRSLYDDAVKMYEMQEYTLALDCSRRCLWEAVAYVNSKNGKPNLKNKWISKIFIDNKGFGNTILLDEYLRLQIYSHITTENIDSQILDMLSLSQSLINSGYFDD